MALRSALLVVFCVMLATAVMAARGATHHYEATFCPNGCTVVDNRFTCTRQGGITLNTNVLTAGTGKVGNHSFFSFIVVALDQAATSPRDFTALFFNSTAVGRSATIRAGTCTNLEVQLDETYMFSFYVVPTNQSTGSDESARLGSESWCSGGKGGDSSNDDGLSAWEIGLIIAAAVAASLVVLLGVGGTAFFLVRRRRASYEAINSSSSASFH